MAEIPCFLDYNFFSGNCPRNTVPAHILTHEHCAHIRKSGTLSSVYPQRRDNATDYAGGGVPFLENPRTFMGNRCPRLWIYILRKRKRGHGHLDYIYEGITPVFIGLSCHVSTTYAPTHARRGLSCFSTNLREISSWNFRESKCCCLCQTGFSLRFRLSRIYFRDWFFPPFTSFKRQGTGFDVSSDFFNYTDPENSDTFIFQNNYGKGTKLLFNLSNSARQALIRNPASPGRTLHTSAFATKLLQSGAATRETRKGSFHWSAAFLFVLHVIPRHSYDEVCFSPFLSKKKLCPFHTHFGKNFAFFTPILRKSLLFQHPFFI